MKAWIVTSQTPPVIPITLHITGLPATSLVPHLPFLASHSGTHLLLTATCHTLLHFIYVAESFRSSSFLQFHSAKWAEGSAQMSPMPKLFFSTLTLGWIFFLWLYCLCGLVPLHWLHSLYVKFSYYTVSSLRTQSVP